MAAGVGIVASRFVELKRLEVKRSGPQVALGLVGIALITYACFGVNRVAIPGFLYLLVVVFQSVWGGFLPAAIVSVVAAGCLEYVFIPPAFQWQIADREDAAALVAYLATSLVISKLASKARNEARNSERRRKEAALLCEAATRLLSLGPEVAAGPESLRIFREVFGLRAACFYDAAQARLRIEGESIHNLAARTHDACIAGKGQRDREVYIRCLHTAGKVSGAVGFEGRMEDSVALALSALAATALERMRAFEKASRAAADAQVETLRSAILDAFAHEFKTPLAIILTAAGGLREVAGCADGGVPAPDCDCRHADLTEIIETQALRLSQLTTRLLRMARLDRENVTPHTKKVSLRNLLAGLIDVFERQSGRKVAADLGCDPAEIMADAELLSLALTQLLDNAGKYSFPESRVVVELDVRDGYAEVVVISEGSVVAPDDRERIFDRFFRGSGAETMPPGAGLGLYVARKIVRAHGGLLELDKIRSMGRSTAFRARLQVTQHERTYEQEVRQSVGGGR